MPMLRDLLAGEQSDLERAASAAAAGRSLTGFSGRHTDLNEPLYGARVTERPGMVEANDPLRDTIPIPPALRGPAMKDRVPFGEGEQQLAFPDRPGYRRYWFNDTPGRLERAKRAGYSHVADPYTGEAMAVVTDRTLNGGRRSYLMETPLQYYYQDMGAQAARLGRRLRDIREGTAGPGANDGRYIPQQGIHISG